MNPLFSKESRAHFMIEDDEVEKVIIELEEILCGEGLYLHAYKMKKWKDSAK